MKKIMTIVLFSIIMASSCLFAISWAKFSLSLSIEKLCEARFWQTGTKTEIENNSVDIMQTLGSDSFATLGLAYKGSLLISVDVGYSPFYELGTEGNETTLDTSSPQNYTMSFRQAGSESAYVYGNGCGSIGSSTSAHYGKQISFNMYRLLNNVNPTTLGSPSIVDGISLIPVCDFYIDNLDLENAASGDYRSLLVCQVTVV